MFFMDGGVSQKEETSDSETYVILVKLLDALVAKTPNGSNFIPPTSLSL